MTKKEMFNHIATVNADNAEIVDFCKHEIELLDKKASSSAGKLTKTQKENEGVKAEILDVLANSANGVTVTQIVEKLDGKYKNQKISALLRQLCLANKVNKEYDKKVALFFLA